MFQMKLLGVSQLLILILLPLCLATGQSHIRILGGDEAPNDATPYAISLRVDSAHVCGASIVSATKWLTAAHCLHRDGQKIDVGRITGRVGSTNQYAGGQIISIASYVIHPDYYKLENNLAVITLSTPLRWTDRVQAIELIGKDEPLPADGSVVSVAGWGTTVEGSPSFKLRQLSLTFAADAVCLDAYSDHDTNKNFCLAHPLKEGICNGDGGGAAVYNGKLLGVCNFVVGACGSRYPDVFVRTAGYSDWLQQQLSA